MIKKAFILSLLVTGAASCAMFKSSGETQSQTASVNYTQHIEPIMQAKCTPCHYPERGRADRLHTYESVRKHINDILYRVQLSPDHKKYMPFKQKKEGLSAEEINLFQQWKAEGFAKG